MATDYSDYLKDESMYSLGLKGLWGTCLQIVTSLQAFPYDLRFF